MSFMPAIKFARSILRPALKQMSKGVPPSLEKLQRDYDELIELSHEVAQLGGLISELLEAPARAAAEAEAAEKAKSKKDSKAEPK